MPTLKGFWKETIINAKKVPIKAQFYLEGPLPPRVILKIKPKSGNVCLKKKRKKGFLVWVE